MKKLIAFIGFTGMFLRGKAQTFAEWFEQNKTQIEYLRDQIIALNDEDQAIEKGYAVDDQGLTKIADDKQADLDLHTYYFSLLVHVNPVIREDPRVNEILSLTRTTVMLTGDIRQSGTTFPRLQESLDSFCTDVKEMCAADLALLGELLQDGIMELSDEERLIRLEKLYEEAKELNELARAAWKDAQFYSSIHELCESYCG